MNRSAAALLSLVLMASTPHVLASSRAAEETFARTALLGMQLSVRKAASQGKVPDSVVACVDHLPSNTFALLFRSLMEQNLSPEEISSIDRFFASETGRKYSKHGIDQMYAAIGETPPEPAPALSDSEYAELDQFSRTSAGEKLMVQKVMESESARRAVSARILELLGTCRAK
jgi:hypothetical protein